MSLVMNKFREVFDPSTVRGPIHIIGCGSVGSCMAELLARYGLTDFHLWDTDVVEAKNIANQMFFEDQIGMPKTMALRETLIRINGDVERRCHEHGRYEGQELSGYVFLCVDHIDVRRKAVEANQYSSEIRAMFDVRTDLYSAQVFGVDWENVDDIENFLRTMEFTQEEALADTPRSACGDILGVAATVRLAVTTCVNNFMMYATKGKLKRSITVSTNLDIESPIFVA